MRKPHSPLVALGLGVVIGTWSMPANSAMLKVRQDGSGDFTTIAAAVAAASDGDDIDVGPGTYREYSSVNKNLHLRSAEGAAATVIDGEGVRRHFSFLDGSVCELEGFTLRRGYDVDIGGSFDVRFTSQVKVTGCRFEFNVAGYDGGAVQVRHSGSRADFVDCSFTDGSAEHTSGAAGVILGGMLTFDHCTFARNEGGVISGALNCNESRMEVRNCLFVANVSWDAWGYGGPGAIHYYTGEGLVEGCTFHGNTSPSRGSVLVNLGSIVETSRNVFSSDLSGVGLAYMYGSAGTRGCNLYWGNAGGPVLGIGLSPTDVTADPLFCNVGADDFHVDAASPVVTMTESCGSQVGAFAAGCGTVEPGVIILAAGSGAAAADAIVQVPVSLQPPAPAKGNPATVSAVDFTVTWDPSVATFSDAQPTTATHAWQLAVNPTPGSARVSMAGLVPLDVTSEPSDILTLEFQLVAAEGSTVLHLENTRVFDADLEPVDHTLDDGSLIVGCNKGDVVADGEINSVDALLTLQFAAQLRTPSSLQACAADMDESGELTSGDAVLILRAAVGLPLMSQSLAANPRVWLEVVGREAVLAFEGIGGLDARLECDPQEAEFVGTGASAGLTAAGTLASGEISVSYASASSAGARIPLGFRLRSPQAAVRLVFVRTFAENGASVDASTGPAAITLGDGQPNPQGTRLVAAAPNPFNPRTEIRFHLDEPGDAVLRVFDALGREVRAFQLPGLQRGDRAVAWDGRDAAGAAVASGVYHVVLEAGSIRDRLPITLVK